MAATLTYDSTGPGEAGRHAMFAAAVGRPLQAVALAVTGDTSYPTGGYDISDVWKKFATASAASGLLHLLAHDRGGAHIVAIDYVNKKLKLMSAPGTEVVAATNVSTTVVDLLALGYAG